MNIFSFLHGFIPSRIAFQFGPLTFYWYGLIMAIAIGVALFISYRLAARRNISSDTFFDLSMWLIVAGVIGARIYEIFLEFPYYSTHLSEIIKIWHGGLAIHGALIGGAIVLLFFIKKHKLDLWNVLAVLVPGVAAGQAIGRFGNWFNQELFGWPTNKPWGIPIQFINRPFGYEKFVYFQPTFLYESLSMIALTIILYRYARHEKISGKLIASTFLIGYGLIRFLLEFIKIDPTPIVLDLRWPQLVSLVMILVGAYLYYKESTKREA